MSNNLKDFKETHKKNEIRDTSHSYILKLTDLLDDKKPSKNNKKINDTSVSQLLNNIEQNKDNNEFLKIIEESIHDDVKIDQERDSIHETPHEEHEKSRNFLPSINNISVIKPVKKTVSSNKKKKKELYELNRKENNIQNEIKLLNREKMDQIKKIERKHHIKMAMVKSSDIIKRNYQNLYDEPYQIEVIDEEDLENSLDNINYILNKKNNISKKFSPKGPHLYIFPHGPNITYIKNENEFQKESFFSNINQNITTDKSFGNSILGNKTNVELSRGDHNISLNNQQNISQQHKNDLIENKLNCEIIEEIASNSSLPARTQVKEKEDKEDTYKKSYNELFSYRKNLKEQVVSEHHKIKSSIESRKKKKKKKPEFFKIENNNGNLQDISRISQQNHGKINIINPENFNKVLKEMVL